MQVLVAGQLVHEVCGTCAREAKDCGHEVSNPRLQYE